MNPIEVVVWPVENGGNLLASAMAIIPTEWGDVKLHRIKVVRSKKGERFISLPQEPYPKDGKQKYAKLIELPSAVMRELEGRIFEKLDP